MDPSSAQHQQEMTTHQTLESMLVCPNTQQQLEKKPRPPQEQALKCPRCDSTNTKFCYYNNYSLSQPRYFCKSCRRYWTQGGTLRNVPVGGGCRRSSSKRSSPSSSSSKGGQDHPITAIDHQSPLPPSLTYGYSSDLSLAFGGLHNPSDANGSMFGFQNLYYGNVGNGNLGGNYGEEMKQEFSNDRGEAENRVLWGIPWQGIGGNGNYYMGELDSSSGREISWSGNSGIGTTNWHGLLNSPLM